MSGLKVTDSVETIKKIRERDLRPLYIGTTGHIHIENLWPPTPFLETWMQIAISCIEYVTP